MSDNLKKASGSLKSFGDNVTKIGSSLTTLTAPLTLAGVAGVKMALDLDTAMRNIQSISKETDEQIAALSDTFVDMSTDITKTTDTAQNLAAAFYDIQGSGFAGEDAMKVLEAATKAATAGLTETAVAATGITAVINSYGMSANDAAHISDLLFETVNRGVGTFEELSSSMSNVVGTANAVGVDFEEVSAAMATMSKQGMSFAESSVALNQTMLAFLKPSTEMAQVISELGYASGQAMIDALGFGGAMEAVSNHVGGSADAMAGLFGNVRALRGALALTGTGAAMFAEDLAAMAAATGSTQAAFAIQTQSFEAQLKNFQNTLGAMLIEIGQILLPIITDLLQNFVIPMIQAFRNLPEPIQKAIVIIGALVTVLGPLLIIIGAVISAIGTIGTAITAIGGVAGIFSAIIAAASGLGAAIAAIGIPILPLVALIGVLGFALSKLFEDKRVQEIPKVWGKNFAMLGEILGIGVQKFVKFNQEIAKHIQENGLWNSMKEFGGKLIQGLIDGIKSKIKEVITAVVTIANKVNQSIRDAFRIRSPSQVMMKLGEQVVAGFNAGIDTMGGIGVQVPQLSGASAGSSVPSLGVPSGAGAGGVYINQLIVPPGTTREQIDMIMREIGKEAKRRGARAVK